MFLDLTAETQAIWCTLHHLSYAVMLPCAFLEEACVSVHPHQLIAVGQDQIREKMMDFVF